MSYIEVKDVSFSYTDDERLVLKDISLNVEKGEFVCLLGQSGCGKSTFLRLLAGLEWPAKGVINVDGKLITKAGLDRGVVFQDYGLFPWMTAGENIVLALTQKFPNKDKRQLKETAVKMLQAVGLDESIMKKYPKALSGGMKQRLLIAQSLLGNSQFLIMDEPTVGLDPKQRLQIRNLIQRNAQNRIILLATHIVTDIEHIADEIILIKNGKINKKKNRKNLIDEMQQTGKTRTLEDVYFYYLGEKNE